MNLTENWNETKTALVDGLEGNKKVVMEQVLENAKTYLTETKFYLVFSHLLLNRLKKSL